VSRPPSAFRRLHAVPNWTSVRPTRSARPSHSWARSYWPLPFFSGVSTPSTRIDSTRPSSNWTSTVSPSATSTTSTVYVFEGSSAFASSMPSRFWKYAEKSAVLKFAVSGT